ncbi:hypothetical protein BGX23_003699 [Mortierella sp. AD031]|nr:hypothetical protein BGX23_003699 [Mortierella sp. AD031]
MSRAPNSSTWTPPISPEAEVKPARISTKARKLSLESISAPRRGSQKDDTTTTTTTATATLTPRSTPAPEDVPARDAIQTRRLCSGVKRDGSRCLNRRKTGCPEDVPFYCKIHDKQAQSQATLSSTINIPDSSREVGNKDMEDDVNSGSDSQDDYKTEKCSGIKTNGMRCRIDTPKKHPSGRPYYCHHHVSQSTITSAEPTLSPKRQKCDGITVNGAPCKNPRPTRHPKDEPFYCNKHTNQAKSLEDIVSGLGTTQARPSSVDEHTSSSSSPSSTRLRTVKKTLGSASTPSPVEEPKIKKDVPAQRQQVRTPRSVTEAPVAPATPGAQYCQASTSPPSLMHIAPVTNGFPAKAKANRSEPLQEPLMPPTTHSVDTLIPTTTATVHRVLPVEDVAIAHITPSFQRVDLVEESVDTLGAPFSSHELTEGVPELQSNMVRGDAPGPCSTLVRLPKTASQWPLFTLAEALDRFVRGELANYRRSRARCFKNGLAAQEWILFRPTSLENKYVCRLDAIKSTIKPGGTGGLYYGVVSSMVLAQTTVLRTAVCFLGPKAVYARMWTQAHFLTPTSITAIAL